MRIAAGLLMVLAMMSGPAQSGQAIKQSGTILASLENSAESPSCGRTLSAQTQPRLLVMPRVSRRNYMGDICNSMEECAAPDFPKCVFNSVRVETICCARAAVRCSSQFDTWCCPAGHACKGDGSPGNPACCD